MPVRYRSPEEDSARWIGFPFRKGDIVISARSKSGTTWVQMICALLIFQTLELPAPLGQLSPWLDHLTRTCDEVYAQLDAQSHRRFIKTHTPLDGIPLDPAVTYIVTARHPLDMAVSLYRQGDNIDRLRLAKLTGVPQGSEPRTGHKPLRNWLVDWINHSADPTTSWTHCPASCGTFLTPGPGVGNRMWCWFTTTTCPGTSKARCADSPITSAYPYQTPTGQLSCKLRHSSRCEPGRISSSRHLTSSRAVPPSSTGGAPAPGMKS